MSSIWQAAFVHLSTRNLLVLACTKSIQVNWSVRAIVFLIYRWIQWLRSTKRMVRLVFIFIHLKLRHQIDRVTMTNRLHVFHRRYHLESSTYARGIASIGQNLLCVGQSYSVTQWTLNIVLWITKAIIKVKYLCSIFQLKETIYYWKKRNLVEYFIELFSLINYRQHGIVDIIGHQFGITCLTSNSNLLISSDARGMILIWNIRTMSQINVIHAIDDSGVTSLSLWNNCIIAAYVNGMIRLFDPENGRSWIDVRTCTDYIWNDIYFKHKCVAR
jgi:hypothetical protein